MPLFCQAGQLCPWNSFMYSLRSVPFVVLVVPHPSNLFAYFLNWTITNRIIIRSTKLSVFKHFQFWMVVLAFLFSQSTQGFKQFTFTIRIFLHKAFCTRAGIFSSLSYLALNAGFVPVLLLLRHLFQHCDGLFHFVFGHFISIFFFEQERSLRYSRCFFWSISA
jgi:hypothetical protein